MVIDSAIFQTHTHHIHVKRMYSGDWYLQVLEGEGLTIHVETREFGTYKEAVIYAFETYGLVVD